MSHPTRTALALALALVAPGCAELPDAPPPEAAPPPAARTTAGAEDLLDLLAPDFELGGFLDEVARRLAEGCETCEYCDVPPA